MKTMMNRLSGAALLFVLMLGSAWAADPNTGTIKFFGEITESSCVVETPQTEVKLQTIPKSLLETATRSAGRKKFTISLSNCNLDSLVNKVGLSFKNTVIANIDQTSGYLNNQTGSATGVQIRLLNDNFQEIDLTTNANSTPVAPSNSTGTGTATLTYYAEYFSPSGATVGAGDVLATIDFDLFYD